MAKPTYYELLRKPEWQRKRLEVMDRAGFKCEECGDTSTTLNVHHKYYTKGAMPWEYPDFALVCLCEPCHGETHNVKKLLSEAMAKLNNSSDLLELLGFVKSILMRNLSTKGNEKFTVGSFEEAWGLVVGMSDPLVDPFCAIDLMDSPGLTPDNLQQMIQGVDVRSKMGGA
jgi:hypothetical protein